MSLWEFWIDRGGTFTDVVARQPDGGIAACKLLSEDPERYDDAVIEGIRRLLRVPAGVPVPAERIGVVRLGTTVATNALLERKGEPTVLVITRGFADALRIAYQNRPRIFDRDIVLPPAALRPGDRGQRADRGPRRGRRRTRRGRADPRPSRRLRRGLPLGRRGVPARLPLPRARGAGSVRSPAPPVSRRSRSRTGRAR